MNELDSKELGQAVRLSREKQGWSQKELADKVGISRSMISKFEKGQRNLSQEKLDSLLDCLDDLEETPVNRVLIDYVTIHFFSLDYKTLTKEILGMSTDHFLEREYAPLGYSAQLVWNNVITISYSIDDPQKGTLIDLSGQGCAHLSMLLKTRKQTWQDFFQNTLNHHGNFTRIDFSLDDFVGMVAIPDLKEKVAKGYVKTIFRKSESHGSIDLIQGESDGDTLYLGSKHSPCRFCFYQKDYEQRKLRGIPLEETAIKNRFELRYRAEKAQLLGQLLAKSTDFTDLFFELLNGAVCFYDRNPNDPTAQIDSKWKTFIGNHDTITIPLESIPQSFEKSMNWLINSVAPTLAFIQTVDEYFGSNLVGQIISCGEISPRQQKLLENMVAEPDYYQEEVEFYVRHLQHFEEEKLH
jgi:phage replication initiation protein